MHFCEFVNQAEAFNITSELAGDFGRIIKVFEILVVSRKKSKNATHRQ